MRVEDYMRKIRKEHNEPESNSYRVNLIKRTLLTTTIVLILLIISNLSAPAKKLLNKYIFETNYNFAKINSIYKKYLLDFTKNKDKTVPVNSSGYLEYKKIEDYKDGALLTIDKSLNVKMLESGLIVYIGEKEDYGSSIVVQQSNGIDVIYGNVTPGDVKIYDYVEKGTIIGTAQDELYLVFTKDGEKLDYKTYIK